MIRTRTAVLTGDIVNSMRLDPLEESRLQKELERVLSPYLFEFFRGDSFQVFIKEPAQALRVALICRTAAMSLTATDTPVRDFTLSSDVRVSIGIGTVADPVKTLGSAKGEAFLLSGRRFDEIQQSEERLSMVSGNKMADIGLQVIADYMDVLFKEMTGKQAEVIHGLLQGETQQKIAEMLNKSKSTVSQMAGSGRWEEIERLLWHFENLINLLV